MAGAYGLYEGALLYVGVMSSAVAFYLMALGLRGAPASHGAIILSFEAVAAFCGWWAAQWAPYSS